MSPLPQLPGPPRSLTNRSRFPRRGVGQKSFAAELIGAPRFCGAPQRASVLSRVATQMSWPPRPLGLFDAMYRLRPSGDWMGHPSLKLVLRSELVPGTASAFTGVLHGAKSIADATAGRSVTRITAPTATPVHRNARSSIVLPFLVGPTDARELHARQPPAIHRVFVARRRTYDGASG